MTKCKFSIGDVVYLKSGSRKQTITEINSGYEGHFITTSWIDFNSNEPHMIRAPEEAFVRKLPRHSYR